MNEIYTQALALPIETATYGQTQTITSRSEKFTQLLRQKCRDLSPEQSARVSSEFNGWGPLEALEKDLSITEILVNDYQQIWYEKNGHLLPCQDRFCSPETYKLFIDRICFEAGTHINRERPMTDGKIRDFRLHLISEELTARSQSLSLRRHPKNPWTLDKLKSANFMTEEQRQLLQDLIDRRDNFLIIGGTGSGKTSLLGACLKSTPPNQRSLIIEDTDEIQMPNAVSNKLLTRNLAQGELPAIDQNELLRQSLRMRPDRIIMGEVRGAEAKDFLMAISTGHPGSFATLHAQDPHQALLRLEMLIQLAAPQWSLSAIRTLIYLGIRYILVVGKDKGSQRRLLGIHRLASREDTGVLLEKLD